MRFHGAEEFAADRFVTSLRQPPAALVPASNVESEGHSRKTVYDRVVQFDARA